MHVKHLHTILIPSQSILYTSSWYLPSAGQLLTHCHAAQIVVNELVLKLLCSYQQENQAWEKEKEEEEEIKAVWPL